MHDLAASETEHLGHMSALASFEAKIGNSSARLSAELAGLDLAQLKAGGCRTLQVGGHEVFELCFTRDGQWYHLYAARGADILPGAGAETKPAFAIEEGQGTPDKRLAVASWSDGRNVYALVTAAGEDALRAVL